MKDSRFNKAIEEISKISMTSAEKQMVLGRVLSSHTDHSERMRHVPVKSPWTVYSFSSWISQHRWVSAVAAIVIVLLAGNSAVLASYDSLPGDVLYPIKVNVVEPVRVAFASTPVVKAEIQAELVQKRLQEAETLAARGALTDAKESDIRERVEKQTAKLAANVAEIKKTAPEKAQDIDITVEASLNTHERVLGAIATNRGQFRGAKTRPTTSDRSVQPAVEPVAASAGASPAVSVAADVAVTAAMSAPSAEVSAAPSASQNRKSPADPEYQKKKARVQSLIQQVTAEMASTTDSASTSLIQQTITEEAKSTLIRAQESLRDADDHSQNGEADQSYSALIDSERSTKEATFLLQAKDRLDKDVRKQEIQSKTRSGEDEKQPSKRPDNGSRKGN